VVRNETIAGNRRYHHRGYQFQFTLTWEKSLITEAQWKIIKDIINKNTQILFVPFPDKYPNSTFYVKSYGGIENITVSNYIGQGYKGNLVLETLNPVTEIPDWQV